MTEPRTRLRLVLVAPDDVEHERHYVVEAATHLNGSARNIPDAHFIDVVRWDPTLRIDEFDVVVCIVWQRLATPSSSGEAGVEHELREAFGSSTRTGHPTIMLYFCERPAPPAKSLPEAEQQLAVRRFKDLIPEELRPVEYSDVLEFRRLISRDLERVRDERGGERRPDPSVEHTYANLFQVSSRVVPYAVMLGGWERAIHEYGVADIKCETIASDYSLPEDFRAFMPRYSHIYLEPKCRLAGFGIGLRPSGLSNQPVFSFSECGYLDYLASGEHLDDPLPGDPSLSFRDKFAPRLTQYELAESRLTNICGVGVFIVTGDDKIIVARHTSNVDVWGEVWSYSASGTMNWVPSVNPFNDVSRECHEEINHTIDPENLLLFAYGVDAKKLYHQFSFVEYSGVSSEYLLREAKHAQDFVAEVDQLVPIPFEIGAVLEFVDAREWEPAAEAGLLTLLAKRFGLAAVEEAVDPSFERARTQDQMAATWDHRAERPGNLAVMSGRYPSARLDAESQQYLDAVMEFLGVDVDGKDILEIGCGIGRLTERLAGIAGRLTALDVSEKMLERTRERLGSSAEQVSLERSLAQDYRPATKHEVAISSLVLIHNVSDTEFDALVEALSDSTDTLFLFEHVDVEYQVTTSTAPRAEAVIREAFEAKGFRVEDRRDYRLFQDNLVFLKLTR